MLQVLVVDDEALARSRLRTLLGDCREPAAAVVAEAGDAVQAMELLHRQRFDLVLLDVCLPGADGLTLARLLRDRPQPQPVVFVSAHMDPAVQAFEVEAVDYLTKPVRLARLQQALQKVQRLGVASAAPADSEVLLIPHRDQMVRLPLSGVVYVKAEWKYLTVRTADRSYLLEGSLADLQARYSERLIRVHRNALAAVGALRALSRGPAGSGQDEGWQLVLEGVPETLAVSRRQLASVRAAFRTRC
jgi:two-component system response regulator AlgR